MAIQKYEKAMESTEDYPQYTKKDIAKENARNRGTSALVPLGNRVYDFKQMFEIIECRIGDVIPNKRFSHDFAVPKIIKAKFGPSTYLGLLGACKFLDIPNELIQEAKIKCVKGIIKDIPCEEQSNDFKKSVDLALQSLSEESCSSEFNSDIVIFKQNCEIWSQKDSAMFEDKVFPPITQYQDQYAFPKPVSSMQYSKKKHRIILPREKQEEYLRKSAALAIEGMNDLINAENESASSHSIQGDSMKEYLLHYRKSYIKSCEVQIRDCTMLKESTIPTVNFNEIEFPLPGYSKNKQMRVYLLDEAYEQFTFDLPVDVFAWTHLPDNDVNIYKIDTQEVNSYFEELLSKRCSDEPFCTDIEVENVWATDDENQHVIKNDVLSENQVALIKSREQRTELNDILKIKNRWKKHLRYFVTKYEEDLSDYNIEMFSGWFERYQQSVKLFEQLCEGTYEQKPRERFDKVKYANEQYEIIMSNRPKLTEEMKQKIQTKFEKIIEYYIKNYKHYEDKMNICRNWLQRMEANQVILDELCESGMVRKNPFESYPNHLAVFTSFETFEETK